MQFFVGRNSGDKIFGPTENVRICNDYCVSDIFRIGVNFYKWGKNLLDGVKIYQVGTSETVICVRSNS